MNACMATPRDELSQYAPQMTTVQIDPEKIGAVIGPGGKTIRGIQEETGAKIDIDDDGTVFIAAENGAAAQRAQEMIERIVEVPEIGRIYSGKVVRTTNFGAFVEFLPGKDGLVHISQLASGHVPSVEDVVRVGDEVMVMVTNIDREGRVRLSRQAVLENWTAEEARENDSGVGGRSSGGRSGGRRR